MTLPCFRILVRSTLVCSLTLACLGRASADQEVSGTSNTGARQDAANALPYRFLRPEYARAVHEIVNKPTIYRRLPIKTIDCDHEMFTYLLRNPEVVVGIWRNMGVTKLSITRSGAHSFEASDGMGTVSQFQLIYGTPKVHVYYGSGYYEGTLLKKKIRAKCVLFVRTGYRRAANGRMAITNVLDMFVDTDNGAINLAAKTLYPLFIRAADENLVTTANFLSQLSYSAEMNPEKVTRLTSQLRQVNPEVRQGFSAVVQRVGGRSDSYAQVANTAPGTPGRATEGVRHARYQRATTFPASRPSHHGHPQSNATNNQGAHYSTTRKNLTISRFPPEQPRYR